MPTQWNNQGTAATTSNARKRRKDRHGGGAQQAPQFGQSPNVFIGNQQGSPQYGGQGTQQYVQGTKGRGAQPPFSNRLKEHDNLLYCFSCGYDVDHNGYQCQNQKDGHIPNVPRDQAHMVYRACMKAQHKTLPDGSGLGQGFVLQHNLTKAAFVQNLQQQGRKGRQQQRSHNNGGNQQQWQYGNQPGM